ncbi:aminobutyraldehyde dehydrogenase [Arthrobacter cupressi]|uniref:Aldehyde dehydrogenase (NAD+)/aminobutyraldehyde dehydrogenase n=1 Tax=Arthrobacter cupressi TaxID=1045773 RepID=A0A1G8K238_9MICC|nr:aminobutyraldehyde dehydrogenase [Arthrobacter cupressi]NYD77361.1 aldehyde dehydrogenase (NAD+)/aminobutyraldehyde dehydrogenase [Arthrobacter cupressi]SDI37463.1 aldehyde dehydrogenase (NAD+)/aminobutyraldehyde dehydrogenase [Arthrobacter cupressi]
MTTTETALPRAAFIVRRAPGQTSAPELPPSGHFINGAFVPGASADLLDVFNPSTGAVLASVAAGTAADVDTAVAAAVAAQASWGGTTPRERSEVLHRIADIIEANRAVFERLEAANTGKPGAVAEDDVSSTIDTFRFMAGACRTLTSLAGGDYAPGHTSVILREPVGVVGVITPWNYPLLMAAWKLAPILAAGNSVVLKPSEQTPLSTLKLAELVAGQIPDGILNVVTGQGRTVGQRLSEHPDIALVALTGSVASGQAVAGTAARSVKRVHLELGGKAPVVVFPDADLATAAAGVRNAGYWNAGQDCGAACRVLVHESVAEEFTRLLAEEVGTLVLGAPDAGDDVEIGPMISRQHFERVKEALAEAKAAGLRTVVGGSALDGPGYFIEPTVIADVPTGAPIASHEIFGPVVTVESFASTEEAVKRANETPYGLSASVWTKDSGLSFSVPKQLDFGTVWVNAHLVLANEVPWGGFKGSGYGRDLSLYALDDYSRTKHVMVNHGA